MSSYNNLSSVSRTLANRIWNGLKDDKDLKAIIKSEKQITYLPPKDTQGKSTQLSVFLYNITEYSSMRNQPQPADLKKPRTLLYLNLRYLITPMTENAETDQILLGKIMQLFAEKPVLRGSDLQGSLSKSGDELRIALDALGAEDLNKLWTTFATPYKLCVSYSVYPVRIEAPAEPEKPVVIEKPPKNARKEKEKDKEKKDKKNPKA